MEIFEKLYEENENVNVRFIGFTTELARYDFGIIYTNAFFGKPLVVCMQTGRSTILDPEDLNDTEYLMTIFKIDEHQQAIELAEFFSQELPNTPLQSQYV